MVLIFHVSIFVNSMNVYQCSFYVLYVEFEDHTCSVAGCKTVIVIDVNMKNARQVCSCADVGELHFDGIPGSILVGEFATLYPGPSGF